MEKCLDERRTEEKEPRENSRVRRILEELKEPGEEFSPIPFWFFNDAFDEGRVKAQLTDYVEKGVNGFVLHPRIGIPEEMPYLSKAYFRAVRFILSTAAGLGMKVVLYDEGMYPSGSAHGMVAEGNPEYGARGIVLLDSERAEEKLTAEEGAETIVHLTEGRQIVYGFTGGTIRGIHFGEDDGEPGAPRAADILNPLAVEKFIRLTHDRYYEELKEYFGTTVIAFFTDEPGALGRNAGDYRPWAAGLDKEIAAAGGSLEELEGLFGEKGERIPGREDIVTGADNKTIRLYHKLIKARLREVYYKRLSDWCGSHGIVLMGHPAESDDIEEELYFQIPGQDLIMRRVAPETGGLREFDSVQAKLTADIAGQLGRRRNANECFGVCCRDKIPWYMTGGDMKWFIDWLGLRGVNLLIPHAFYYSVEGKRKEERPPDAGPNNIWWRHYRRFSDYIKRLCYLMTDSVVPAKLAVLCDNNRVPGKEIACLYENQIGFHYLPASLLEQAQMREGRVCIREYSYNIVLNLLGEEYEERFRSRLGTALVTAAGQEEEAVLRAAEEAAAEAEISAERKTKKEYFPETKNITLGAVCCPACKDLRMVRLNKMGVCMLLLGNEGKEAVETEVKIPGMKNAIGLDLWKIDGTGSRSSRGETFALRLEPRETVLLIPNVPEELAAEAGKNHEETAEYPDWTGRFFLTEKEENRAVYTLRYEYQKSEKSFEKEPDKDGRGDICGFFVRAEEMVECYCNGAFVDVSFWGIHRFCLKGFQRQGQNEIRLVVTGNAANLYENAGIRFGLGVCND